MGNFEEAIPKNIAELEKQIGSKRRKVWDIERAYNHDCDCEYCTVEPEEPSEEVQEEIDELNKEVEDMRLTINRLKRHAKANNIEVPA